MDALKKKSAQVFDKMASAAGTKDEKVNDDKGQDLKL
jgi:hypothetical protein